MWQFSAPVSISFYCESCSSIESLISHGSLWHRLCFFLCIRSILPLQTLYYQFLLQYLSRKTRRCPGLCECLSFARLHLRHQCYLSRWCFFSLVLSFCFTIFLYLPFVCMMSRSILLAVFFFVEFSKDIGNPFSRRDDFSFSFFILVMSTLFFADLIPGMFLTPLKSSSILWMSCCLFILFCH